ncbi:thiamine pyrophosphate-dependent enzyme [Nocardia sp. NPDC051570]|uniref:thiamine pyrophosphate-dependent enzyme n=1 Tax=Nocardia sp. NPDC051570 TaxID=3364324 RepID=UPI00379E57C3
MSKHTVADALWETLVGAGVRRCYGIIGDALNPTIDALRRNGQVEFVHVRHEEAGVFAAVADAYLSGVPVAVCGTAGPGATHLLNGLIDAKHEGAPVIAVVGDTATAVQDTRIVEAINPYDLFQVASLYTGRIINPEQTRAVVQTAVRTAIAESGPTVIALAGDIAAAPAPKHSFEAIRATTPVLRPNDDDLRTLAGMIDAARAVTIFGGDGCRHAHDQVVALAERIKAPVGYSYRGKQWLEGDNPYGVGMTGLLGYGGAYSAMHDCDLCLMLGTDFPFPEFLPTKSKLVQVDRRADHLGRRTHLDLALVGDVGDTLDALLPLVRATSDSAHLDKALHKTAIWRDKLGAYVHRGPTTTPIRPEYLVSVLDTMADDDACFAIDTGTACIWGARYLTMNGRRRLLGSFSWGSMANAMPYTMGMALAYPGRQTIGLCGDGGLTMLLGDLLTIAERRLPIKLIVLNNSRLDFVHIEMEESGMQPFGTRFTNPNFADLAKAMGLNGIRVEHSAEVSDAVKELLAADGPALLDAVVDPAALSMPPHVSFGMAEGFALSLAKQALHGDLGEVVDTATRNIHLL